jgi:hypothetical protein
MRGHSTKQVSFVAVGPAPDDPGNPTVNWRGERRTNATHASTTNPEAMLARTTRGSGTKLAFRGHAVTENRNGLCVDVSVSRATGTHPGLERAGL